MALFNNKHRVETTRLHNWDYGSSAHYFITICTKNKAHFFGLIRNDEIILSPLGDIVHNEWLQTPVIRPDMNLTLGEFAIMPNHFHAIISIGDNKFNSPPRRDGMHPVSTDTVSTDPVSTDPASKQQGLTQPDSIAHDLTKNRFGTQSKNLSSIIRGFKSSVTIKAKKTVPDFGWQERFYDHIIRNDESYNRISRYIIDNPANWKNDKLYS